MSTVAKALNHHHGPGGGRGGVESALVFLASSWPLAVVGGISVLIKIYGHSSYVWFIPFFKKTSSAPAIRLRTISSHLRSDIKCYEGGKEKKKEADFGGSECFKGDVLDMYNFGKLFCTEGEEEKHYGCCDPKGVKVDPPGGGGGGGGSEDEEWEIPEEEGDGGFGDEGGGAKK